MSDVAILGPIAARRWVLSKACEANQGHEHNYDHTTIVIHGRVKVLYEYESGGQTVKGESGEFGPGQDIFIRAKVRHTIKALEDNTVYMCIFSHRDFGGVVIETYTGNQSAYD
jgi:quercetin dioxygenase-like cupin family protein